MIRKTTTHLHPSELKGILHEKIIWGPWASEPGSIQNEPFFVSGWYRPWIWASPTCKSCSCINSQGLIPTRPKLGGYPWDPDRWRWTDVHCFLNYTSKMVRDLVINRIPSVTRAAEKWQGYLPSNYRFHWSQVWDPLRSDKEAAFMWPFWHKAVAVN